MSICLFIFLIPAAPFAVHTVNIVDILSSQFVISVLYCSVAHSAGHPGTSCMCTWTNKFLKILDLVYFLPSGLGYLPINSS